jgi:hypothetical protein
MYIVGILLTLICVFFGYGVLRNDRSKTANNVSFTYRVSYNPADDAYEGRAYANDFYSDVFGDWISEVKGARISGIADPRTARKRMESILTSIAGREEVFAVTEQDVFIDNSTGEEVTPTPEIAEAADDTKD